MAEFPDADRTAFRKIGGAHPGVMSSPPCSAICAVIPRWGGRLPCGPADAEHGAHRRADRGLRRGRHLVETPRGGCSDLSTATERKRFRDDASAAQARNIRSCSMGRPMPPYGACGQSH